MTMTTKILILHRQTYVVAVALGLQPS